MKKYKIGVAVEVKVVEVEANSLKEAESKAWKTLTRKQKDCHCETYEVD